MKHNQKCFFMFICLLIVPFIMPMAVPLAHTEDFRNVELVRVYDGDTIFVNIKNVPEIFGKNIGIRVRGIDTPEIRGKCDKEKTLAHKARDYVITILQDAEQIDLIDVDRDKYFRILATVMVDGVDLSYILLEKTLAVEYDGGKKPSWC